MEVGVRPRKFLIITGIIELLLLFPAILFTVFFGYQGFIAGEMGTMIGMFSVALILFLIPYLAARTAAVQGLRKMKRWAPVLCIVLSALVLTASLFTAFDFPFLFALILIYISVSIWSAVVCLRHPGYKKRG